MHELHEPTAEQMTTRMFPSMLTVEQAAKVACISRRHAYHLVASGDLPSVRFGKAIRVPAHRLLELLEGEREAET